MSLTWAMWLTLVTSSLSVLLARGAPSELFPYDASDDEPGEERWLGDGSFYDIDHIIDHPQADGPGVVELCPPVPRILPPGGCDLKECSSDRECQPNNLMCCYNGCVYTCLPQVLPAPYFDWIREPRRRRQFGRSWLVPGPDTNIEVELCSTTLPTDDSDPLLCPHGFECVIDKPGNSAKSIPNMGHCVKTSDSDGTHDQDSLFKEHNIPKNSARASIAKVKDRKCKLDEGRKLLHGHTTVVDGRKCLCKDTKLICTT